MIKRTKIYRGGAKAAPKPKKSFFKRLANSFRISTRRKANISGSDPGPTKKKRI